MQILIGSGCIIDYGSAILVHLQHITIFGECILIVVLIQTIAPFMIFGLLTFPFILIVVMHIYP